MPDEIYVAWATSYPADAQHFAPLYDQAALDADVAAERERCAKLCEGMGAMEALEGEEFGSAAMVRAADRMADLCAAAIRGA